MNRNQKKEVNLNRLEKYQPPTINLTFLETGEVEVYCKVHQIVETRDWSTTWNKFNYHIKQFEGASVPIDRCKAAFCSECAKQKLTPFPWKDTRNRKSKIESLSQSELKEAIRQTVFSHKLTSLAASGKKSLLNQDRTLYEVAKQRLPIYTEQQLKESAKQDLCGYSNLPKDIEQNYRIYGGFQCNEVESIKDILSYGHQHLTSSKLVDNALMLKIDCEVCGNKYSLSRIGLKSICKKKVGY